MKIEHARAGLSMRELSWKVSDTAEEDAADGLGYMFVHGKRCTKASGREVGRIAGEDLSKTVKRGVGEPEAVIVFQVSWIKANLAEPDG